MNPFLTEKMNQTFRKMQGKPPRYLSKKVGACEVMPSDPVFLDGD